MNYFEHFGLKPVFQLDLNELRQKYYQKSKDLHPDTNKKEEHDYVFLTALNNQAYQTLKDPLSRLKYIIELYRGALSEDEFSLSQDFLIDMMELHEAIHEAIESKDNAELSRLKSKIELMEKDALQNVLPAISKLDAVQINEDVLNNLIEYYFKLKYFKRLHQNLGNESAEM